MANKNLAEHRKNQAVALRKDNKSYKEIADRLGISVSSVGRYLRDSGVSTQTQTVPADTATVAAQPNRILTETATAEEVIEAYGKEIRDFADLEFDAAEFFDLDLSDANFKGVIWLMGRADNCVFDRSILEHADCMGLVSYDSS